MSSITFDHSGPSHRTTQPVRRALRWIRETPAPEWSDAPGAKGRVIGYVAVNMLVWTGIGIGGATLVSRALEALPTILG